MLNEVNDRNVIEKVNSEVAFLLDYRKAKPDEILVELKTKFGLKKEDAFKFLSMEIKKRVGKWKNLSVLGFLLFLLFPIFIFLEMNIQTDAVINRLFGYVYFFGLVGLSLFVFNMYKFTKYKLLLNKI